LALFPRALAGLETKATNRARPFLSGRKRGEDGGVPQNAARDCEPLISKSFNKEARSELLKRPIENDPERR